MILETLGCRGLDLLDLSHAGLDFTSRIAVEEGNPRARASGIARRGNLFEIAVGYQPEHHGVLSVDVCAECTREPDSVDFVHSESLHQEAGARVKRSLRELNGTTVVLQ